MNIEPLSVQEQAQYGATHSIKITHADLTETTNNTAQTLATVSVGNGTTCKFAGYFLETAFQDASDSGFNDTAIEVGDGVLVNR